MYVWSPLHYYDYYDPHTLYGINILVPLTLYGTGIMAPPYVHMVPPT